MVLSPNRKVEESRMAMVVAHFEAKILLPVDVNLSRNPVDASESPVLLSRDSLTYLCSV